MFHRNPQASILGLSIYFRSSFNTLLWLNGRQPANGESPCARADTASSGLINRLLVPFSSGAALFFPQFFYRCRGCVIYWYFIDYRVGGGSGAPVHRGIDLANEDSDIVIEYACSRGCKRNERIIGQRRSRGVNGSLGDVYFYGWTEIR